MDGLDEDEEQEDPSTRIQLTEILPFLRRAIRKHLVVSLLLFAAVTSLGVFASKVIPHKYQTRTRVLFNPEGIRARVIGERVESDLGLVSAVDQIFRQENLRGIVQDAKLVENFSERRPPLLRSIDSVRGGGLSALPKTEQIRALMGTLETRLHVEVDHRQPALNIWAEWNDPQTALDITKVARDRFLADRLHGELEVFEQVLEILEEQERGAAREVERRLSLVENASWRGAPPAATATAVTTTPGETRPRLFMTTRTREAEVDPTLVVQLEKVRRTIRELQDPWRNRITALQLQLTDLSASYGPKHPLVLNQEARLKDAQVPPPELEELKRQEAILVSAIEEASRPITEKVVQSAGGSTSSASTPTSTASRTRVEASATLSTEQSKLLLAIQHLNDLSDKIEKTRLELGTAETAFKYRYTIASEPELPRKPLKPTLPLMIALGATFAGALLALVLGPLLELLSGRLLAPWQIKTLGIPVLGEVSLRSDDQRLSSR